MLYEVITGVLEVAGVDAHGRQASAQRGGIAPGHLAELLGGLGAAIA